MSKQEHYSLVSKPNGLFLGFVTVENGFAKCAPKAILKKKIYDLRTLGSDGTNTNFGADGGIN